MLVFLNAPPPFCLRPLLSVLCTCVGKYIQLPDGGGVAVEGGYPAAAEARSNVGGRGEGGLGDEISGGGQQQAPPSRPCFDSRANDGGRGGTGGDTPPKKRSMFRRLLNRRD